MARIDERASSTPTRVSAKHRYLPEWDEFDWRSVRSGYHTYGRGTLERFRELGGVCLACSHHRRGEFVVARLPNPIVPYDSRGKVASLWLALAKGE